MTNKGGISRPFQVLTRSFIVALANIVILIIVAEGNPTRSISPFEGILILTMIASGLAFYVSLGVLAKRMGGSWIVWVGLTFITNPVGPFVAYFRMRQLVNTGGQPSSSGGRPNISVERDNRE
jgi:hypothetical protein